MFWIFAIVLALLAVRPVRAVLAVAWEAPFAWLVPLVAAALVAFAPMMPDMIAALGDGDDPGPMIGFAAIVLLLGLTGWHWMRAVLAARYGAKSEQDWQRQYPTAAHELGLRPGEAYAIRWAPRLSVVLASFISLAAVAGAYDLGNGVLSLDALILAVPPVLGPILLDLRRRWVGQGPTRPPLSAFGYGPTWRAWWTLIPSHLGALLRGAPLGLGFALVLLAAVPVWMLWIAWAPEALPPAPTAAILSLALLVGPLSVLHALIARVPVAPRAIAFLTVLAMLFVVSWDPPGLYAVRGVAGEVVASRPDLPTALAAWRAECGRDGTAESPAPVFIVAAEGGASRAALWTLAALRRLDAVTDGEFGRRLFALSGVSGGSLGVATYAAVQAAAPGNDGCGVNWGSASAAAAIARVAEADYLKPVVAAYFLTDTLRRLLPVGAALAPLGTDGLPDRAAALEASFEQGWRGAGLGAPHFLGVRAAQSPHLLMNGTDVASGRRLITSTIAFGQQGDGVEARTGDVLFADAEDLLVLLGTNVRLATAVTNSARFPYISPAGRFVRAPDGAHGSMGVGSFGRVRQAGCEIAALLSRGVGEAACAVGARGGQVVDGGYFENFGAATALELARKIEKLSGSRLRSVVVVISNSGEAPKADQDARTLTCTRRGVLPTVSGEGYGARYGNEVLAPISGLYAIRSAHGLAALHALRRELCDADPDSPDGALRLVHLSLPKPDPGLGEAAPMNWVLNERTRAFMLGKAFDTAPLDAPAWTPFNAGQAGLLCGKALGLACGRGGTPPPIGTRAGSAEAATATPPR